jgi:hypothetical protein
MWLMPNSAVITWWTLSMTQSNCQTIPLMIISCPPPATVQLYLYSHVTRMPGLPLWVSKTMLLFPSLKTLTPSKSCRSAHCFCSITVHKHSLTSVTSLHCLFKASHKILSHVSASERTKYNFTQPFKNRFLTGADTNTQMPRKMMTLVLVAKRTWGSNTAHAPSQSRPLNEDEQCFQSHSFSNNPCILCCTWQCFTAANCSHSHQTMAMH